MRSSLVPTLHELAECTRPPEKNYAAKKEKDMELRQKKEKLDEKMEAAKDSGEPTWKFTMLESGLRSANSDIAYLHGSMQLTKSEDRKTEFTNLDDHCLRCP